MEFKNNVNSVLFFTFTNTYKTLFRTISDLIFIDICQRMVVEHIIFRSRDQQIDYILLHNTRDIFA